MMPSPLRELDPDQPKRLHTFGNPFKQDKKVRAADRLLSAVRELSTEAVSWQGMMIDEADEFVVGPQSKKRGNSGDPSAGATLKRRRSMSPLLRRPQTPPGSTNHVMMGKSPPAGQQTPGASPQHRGRSSVCRDTGRRAPRVSWLLCAGVDGSLGVADSNGDGALGPESGDVWPPEDDCVSGSLGDKDGLGVTAGGEDDNTTEGRTAEEDAPDQQPQVDKHNCERLSPSSPLEADESAPLHPIVIPPLDGSQAELRTRVIKEVRKPGRSEWRRNHTYTPVH